MQIYPEGAAVSLNVAFVDDMGAPVSPIEVSAVLKNDRGVTIQTIAPVNFAPEATSADILIEGACQSIDAKGELSVRELCVTMRTNARTIEKRIAYGVEAEEGLQICVNSFQSYSRAMIEGSMLVNLTSFNSEVSDTRKKAALIEAFRRIINIRLTYEAGLTDQTRWYTLSAFDWDEITEDAFVTQFPSRLRRALCHAQLIEANEILQGNILAQKHAAGIQSETIGESSVTLRAGAGGAGSGVSSFALAVLAPFIDNSIRIGRA